MPSTFVITLVATLVQSVTLTDEDTRPGFLVTAIWDEACRCQVLDYQEIVVEDDPPGIMYEGREGLTADSGP